MCLATIDPHRVTLQNADVGGHDRRIDCRSGGGGLRKNFGGRLVLALLVQELGNACAHGDHDGEHNDPFATPKDARVIADVFLPYSVRPRLGTRPHARRQA